MLVYCFLLVGSIQNAISGHNSQQNDPKTALEGPTFQSSLFATKQMKAKREVINASKYVWNGTAIIYKLDLTQSQSQQGPGISIAYSEKSGSGSVGNAAGVSVTTGIGNTTNLFLDTCYAIIHRKTGRDFSTGELHDLNKTTSLCSKITIDGPGKERYKPRLHAYYINPYWVKLFWNDMKNSVYRLRPPAEKGCLTYYHPFKDAEKLCHETKFGLEEYSYVITPGIQPFKQDYRIEAHLVNFRFQDPTKAIKDSVKIDIFKTENIVHCGGSFSVGNFPGSKTLTQTSSIQLSNSVISSLSQFDSVEITETAESTGSASLGAFGALFSFGASSDNWSSKGSKWGKEKADSSVTTTVSRQVTFSVNHTISMDSLSCLKVASFVNWISEVEVKYTADLEVRIVNKITKESVVAEQVEKVVRELGILDPALTGKVKDGKLLYGITGSVEGSMGLDLVFSALPLTGPDCPC